jgi:hypothetical protein
MKRLQIAMLQKGLPVSISTSQFYSFEQNRFIPVIILSIRTYHYFPNLDIWKDQNYEILRTTSQPDALNCMVEIYKAVSA